MALSDERAAYVALALTPGIGPQRLTALLTACQTAHGALAAPFAFLCSVPSISPAAATAIGQASIAAGAAVLARVEAMGARCLLRDDPEYPTELRTIPDPPGVLFAQGDLSLLGRPAVAVVGSRDHSAYGGEVGRNIAGAAAAAGLVVVSGMARGLDAVAQTAALDAGGLTLGVLGNGLGVVYPAANRTLYQRVEERGLLLTEFPPGDKPMAGSFPRRNRLISGLARVTLVIEAAAGSGTLITVAMALEQGRDVMVVPGNITSPTSVGTNRLLRDGAEPLLEIADLLRHYPELGAAAAPAGEGGVARPAAPPPGLTPEEASIYQLLAAGPLGLDDLVARSDLPAARLLSLITTLELRGLLAPRAGRLALTNQ
ncbi:MAG: DNA-protecting protein DprA [Gemmatimonadetes bacterium]|nr:DNA-protecting protein DprA [Gemmatimonadota bacterium]MBK7923846.1 DNA-protecting protein DprA [Gemmatimonadota bacterium]